MAMMAIENQIGRLFHAFYENNAVEMTQLFLEDAVLKQLDQKLCLKGNSEILSFWSEEIENRQIIHGGIPTVYLPCDIFIRKEDEGKYYGEWDTYSFRSEANGEVQYFLTHMQAWFVQCEDQWKISELVWNEILEMEPWVMTGTANADVVSHMSRMHVADEHLSVQDYIAIRNLQGHFTHEGMERKAEWFCDDINAELDLPSLYKEVVYGGAAVKARIKDLKAREIKNDKNYMFLPMICAPLITGENDRARGMWLVLNVEVKAQDFGIENPPYQVVFNIGRFNQEFVKREGRWQFLKFRHEILFTIDGRDYDPEYAMRHRMREKELENTWLSGPEESGVACSADVFDIEMTMPQWTGRLRGGNSMEFVDQYMVNSVEEISMLVAGSTQNRTYGYENIKARFGPKPENKAKKENPVFHTLATPVIEFSEDGNHAYAAWTDFAIADFSGAFNFPAEPVCYYSTANKYYHEFVRDGGQWKLFNFGWEPGIFLGGFKFTAEKCRGFYKGWGNMHVKFPLLGESYVYEIKDND